MMHMFAKTAATAAAALAAIAFASAHPALAQAQQSQDRYETFATAMQQTGPLPSAGAYTGTLRLTIASDGVVNGWYIPSDNERFVPVVGGLQQGKMWLNIGSTGDLIVDAVVQRNGSITGSATETSAYDSVAYGAGYPATFSFSADPQK